MALSRVTNSVEWANGVGGGTPLSADNLNKINKDTATTLNEVITEVNTLEETSQSAFIEINGKLDSISNDIGNINTLLIQINDGSGV